jgi:hypothetical protein
MTAVLLWVLQVFKATRIEQGKTEPPTSGQPYRTDTLIENNPMVRTRLLILMLSFAALLFGLRSAAAQRMVQHVAVSPKCKDLNEVVLAQAAMQRIAEAESTLAAAVADRATHIEDSCAGLILNNLAAQAAFSGKTDEAEGLAKRSVEILEKVYSPEDRVLLRPLQILAATQFEQRKFARARQAFNRMRMLRLDGAEDQALVHGMAGAFLHVEHKLQEAETEYLAANRRLGIGGKRGLRRCRRVLQRSRVAVHRAAPAG